LNITSLKGGVKCRFFVVDRIYERNAGIFMYLIWIAATIN